MGEYTLLMMKSITLPDRWSMFFKQLIKEIYKLGVDSLWIVIIISVFIGTVIAIQISLNISSPLIPKFTIGYTTREIILLEFSSSIMALILAGKVGSNIASEIGTMRVTEQIDAMEIMGVNSANFLILPKMLGLMIFIPVLVIFSMPPMIPVRQLLNEYGNDSFLVRVRFAILLQRVLHLVFYYQIRSICVHHLIHRRLFWL